MLRSELTNSLGLHDLSPRDWLFTSEGIVVPPENQIWGGFNWVNEGERLLTPSPPTGRLSVAEAAALAIQDTIEYGELVESEDTA